MDLRDELSKVSLHPLGLCLPDPSDGFDSIPRPYCACRLTFKSDRSIYVWHLGDFRQTLSPSVFADRYRVTDYPHQGLTVRRLHAVRFAAGLSEKLGVPVGIAENKLVGADLVAYTRDRHQIDYVVFIGPLVSDVDSQLLFVPDPFSKYFRVIYTPEEVAEAMENI